MTKQTKTHSFDKMQKFNAYARLLPNQQELRTYAYSEFKEIKNNLAKSVVLNELRPGLMHWTTRLQTFINEYGICFKKTDHISLIQFYLEVIHSPNIDFGIINICLSILVELLKKIQLLSRQDLQIDWKPIYKLYLRISSIDDRSTELIPNNLEQVTFVNFACYARIYFDVNATREMLAEWRPLMCPFDMSMVKAFELFDLFLPTLLNEPENEFGFKLWLNEFLELWLTSAMSRSYWESSFISLLSRVAADNIGLFDWSPYIPYIFSKLLRGLGLTLATGDSMNINDGTHNDTSGILNGFSLKFAMNNTDIYHLTKLIVSMIGVGKEREKCMEHILQMFRLLRSYFYPSNTGISMGNFYAVLESFPTELIDRIRHEQSDKYSLIKSKSTVKSNQILQTDINTFVNCLKDIVLTAIFSKTHFNDAIKTYQYLCFLRPDIMLPPLLAKISSSFDKLIEPHRYTSMLACLVSVPRELAIFTANNDLQTLNIIDLLCAILPGIDVNDLNKFILTTQLLANVLSCISVCDCSSAVDQRTDLTDKEIYLCIQTAKFEDFVCELLKKIFDFIENLASEISSDDMETTNDNFLSKNLQEITEENVIQSHMLQMMKVFVIQASGRVLKTVVKKVRVFIEGKSFSFRSGSVIGAFCGYLAVSPVGGKEAFETFFNYLYITLKAYRNTKEYKKNLLSVKVDGLVKWNLQLLSYLLEAKGFILIESIDKIMEIITWYKPHINMDCIGHLTNSFNRLIVSMTSITSLNQSSFNEFTLDDTDTDFFKRHLPIRSWGKYISLEEFKVDYYTPSKQELKKIVGIVEVTLNESMDFLSKSLMVDRESGSITKEENYRELNIVYHVLFGASRLLKRPSHKIVLDHLESSCEVGVSDEINKGLGFEKAALNQNLEEFTDAELNVLRNLRDQLTQFILRLGNKLVKNNSTDTVLLILISRILAISSMTYGWFADDFKKSWESHFITKATIQNKLINKQYPRDELIRRLNLQYIYRSFHIHTQFNQQDLLITEFLSNLAINSAYEIVRKEARDSLYSIYSQYPYSGLTLLPKLIKHLERNNSEKTRLTKDQLEGVLLLINGNSQASSFLLKQSWSVANKVWPVLFRLKHFQKEADLSGLLDAIYEKTNNAYESYDNFTRFSSKAVINAFLICPYLATDYKDVTDELRLAAFTAKSLVERKAIISIQSSLIASAYDTKLPVKNQRISLFSLIYLFGACQSSPDLLTSECVRLFVDCLVHENVMFRQISVDGLCIILKMIKPKKEIRRYKILDVIGKETEGKITDLASICIDEKRPGYRLDNTWHLYKPKFLNSCFDTSGLSHDQDLNTWKETFFVDKSYWGYYCWPSEIPINSNQRPVFTKSYDSQYKSVIRPILKHFHKEPEFVEKFIRYATIEESKGSETFDKKRFHLFKALFRNFGTIGIFNGLFIHLERLVTDRDQSTQETNHKLAAELVAGLIRGSKYWQLTELKEMWAQLKIIFDIVVTNLSTVNLDMWIQCLSTSFEDQDPRRMTFYLNYFQELFLNNLMDLNLVSLDDNSQKSSFEATSVLRLMSAFSQFEWRIPTFWASLLPALQQNMSSPNKLVRDVIPTCLSLLTKNYQETGINLVGICDKESIQESVDMLTFNRFIRYLEKRLDESYELFEILGDKTNVEKIKDIQRGRINEFISSLNFLQTTIGWLYAHLPGSLQAFNRATFKIFAKLCLVDKVASYEDKIKIMLTSVRAFMPVLTLDEILIEQVVEAVVVTGKNKNWKTRVAGIQIVQNLSVFNFFLLGETRKQIIKKIVVDSLADDELRVRQTAAVALTSLIHSGFVGVDDEMINAFKRISKVRSKKDKELLLQNLAGRHSGILGMCAIVNASPYDVPDYIPGCIEYLCHFTNDIAPIKDSVAKCVSDFKKTHQDNWLENSLKFNEEQLNMLSETSLSQNYYA